MKYLLFVLYFFSTVSFASHCSGAHDDDDHRADHTEESKESVKMDEENNEESTEAVEDTEKDA